MLKDDYFTGITKSLINAEELILDAKLLFENNRFARAYTLYQIALEEIGKASMLYNFLLSENYKNKELEDKFLKTITRHQIKTEHSIGLDLFLAKLTDDNELKEKIIYNIYEQENKIQESDNLKNNSLYTNLVNTNFFNPNEVIDKMMVKKIQFKATTRLEIAKQIYKLEIENFDEILDARRKTDIKAMINNPPNEIITLANFKINNH